MPAHPGREEIVDWLSPQSWPALLPLMTQASALVSRPQDLELCAIANIGFGSCEQNCAFCAQSAHAPAINHFVMPYAEILERAQRARARGARRFGLVATGGYCPEGKAFVRICRIIEKLRASGIISPCASLGILRPGQAKSLFAAGLVRYHHNLETGPDFFPQICTSHTWQERWGTNLMAREAGLEICCGGLIGLGESPHQRAELPCRLAELKPESIPLNFYIAVNGGLKNAGISPLQALAACAVFKILNPTSVLRLCGGREQSLAALSPLAHLCGMEGMMVGDYLTTKGAEELADQAQMLALMRRPSAKPV